MQLITGLIIGFALAISYRFTYNLGCKRVHEAIRKSIISGIQYIIDDVDKMDMDFVIKRLKRLQSNLGKKEE